MYPHEAGASYANVQPYYDALGQSKAPAAHDWFPDAVNTGTGPLTPLWTAMQEAADRGGAEAGRRPGDEARHACCGARG